MEVTRAQYERLRRGWTQIDVATKLGIANSRICDIERGRVRGTKYGRVLRVLADLYGILPPELFEKVQLPDGMGTDVWEWRKRGYWVR